MMSSTKRLRDKSAPNPLEAGPIVTLTVDDCWESHARRFDEAFRAKSLQAVFYVIAGFVGKEINKFKFTDWDALRQMSAQGHEIGSHSFTHKVSAGSMST